MFVAPSPKKATATRGSRAQLESQRRAGDRRQTAPDDRVGAHVAALDVVQVHRAAVAVRTALELPVQLRHQLVRRRPLRERVSVGAMCRRDDVALLQRAADADRDGLLADGHVQEPGKLPGPEPFLDLLLESPDQQHLAEELAQIRLRERSFLLHLRHEPQFMLRLLRLVEQLSELERGLVDEWAELRFQLTMEDESRAERAAALLAPANPGRLGKVIRLAVDRRGPGIAPEALRRLLKRLDDEGIAGTLELQGIQKAPPEELPTKETLRAQWELRLAAVPPDWSDIYAQVRLDSTDYLERGALLLAPINPARYGGPAALRFRSAQHFGYGVSPGMAARCFERCDEEGITGEVEILYVLSDTNPEATQGPVWLLGGRTV